MSRLIKKGLEVEFYNTSKENLDFHNIVMTSRNLEEYFKFFPHLEGILKRGGTWLDLGCGYAYALLQAAALYPNSRIVGISKDVKESFFKRINSSFLNVFVFF